MSGKGRTGAAVLEEHVLLLDVTKLAQHAVNSRADVSHADQQAIPVRPARICGTMLQGAVEQQKQVQGRHRAPRMTALRQCGTDNDAPHAVEPHCV